MPHPTTPPPVDTPDPAPDPTRAIIAGATGSGLPPLTLLLVEDSRFAADGIRQLVRRLGLRMRRPQSLADAQAHLRVYRPDIAVIDIGLPDGSGLDLIGALQSQQNRPFRIVATSGDPGVEGAARAAGAQGFIAKPSRLADLIPALLGPYAPLIDPSADGLPLTRLPGGAMRNTGADPMALRDDLRQARDLLDRADDPQQLRYVAQFLHSVARLIDERPMARSLADSAASLDRSRMRDAALGMIARGAAL